MAAHHSDFVADIFFYSGHKTYLELGIFEGETISKVKKRSQLVVGVDVIDRGVPDIVFFKGTTQQFFAQCSNKFDMIFIDADHSFDSVVQDLNFSLDFLSEGGTILLHDTDPEEKRLLDKGYCGDAYKIVEYLKNRKELQSITFPLTEAGLTIVKRHSDRRALKL